MNGPTLTRKIHFHTGRRSRKELREGGTPQNVPRGKVPRISRLMALAIRFDQLIRDGVVADQAELARLGHVSRARLTQIMNLLNLAPDIQEVILCLPPTQSGKDTVTERHLRPIAAKADWEKQSRLWKRLLGRRSRHYNRHFDQRIPSKENHASL